MLSNMGPVKTYVYVGSSWMYRWTRTAVGVDGTAAECVMKYSKWLFGQGDLMRKLPTLRGCILMCDCKPGMPCHTDILCTLVDLSQERKWDSVPESMTREAISNAIWRRPTRSSLPSFDVLYWGDSAASLQVDRSGFRRLFPAAMMGGVKFPCISDLVNQDPFTTFLVGLDTDGLDSDTSTEPLLILEQNRGWRSAA